MTWWMWILAYLGCGILASIVNKLINIVDNPKISNSREDRIFNVIAIFLGPLILVLVIIAFIAEVCGCYIEGRGCFAKKSKKTKKPKKE